MLVQIMTHELQLHINYSPAAHFKPTTSSCFLFGSIVLVTILFLFFFPRTCHQPMHNSFFVNDLLNRPQIYNWQQPDMIMKLISIAFSLDTWFIFIKLCNYMQTCYNKIYIKNVQLINLGYTHESKQNYGLTNALFYL